MDELKKRQRAYYLEGFASLFNSWGSRPHIKYIKIDSKLESPHDDYRRLCEDQYQIVNDFKRASDQLNLELLTYE